MLIVLAVANVAIALLCLRLAWWMTKVHRQVTQLNRDLHRWTIGLERGLGDQTLAWTQHRAQLRQWQLGHLQWQLQQRKMIQLAKLLQLLWFIRQRRWR